MRVSVIIPVHNGEAVVGDALESVHRQTRLPEEVVVVDDGSMDRTAAVVKAFGGRVRFAHQRNQGPSVALNHGLGLARGEAVAFLDADDMWSEDKLELQVRLLEKDPSVDVVAGQTRWFRVHPVTGAFDVYPEDRVMLSLSCATMRRSVFEQVGSFDAKLPLYGFDSDWFLRAKEAGAKLVIHREVTLYYRRHAANVTNNQELDKRFYLNSIKRSLQRRRRLDEPVHPLSPWFGGSRQPIRLRPS